MRLIKFFVSFFNFFLKFLQKRFWCKIQIE
jgi:hypothetical protein